MLKIAVEAALEAGALLKANSGRAKTIERKAGQETNLVTEIDRKAEEIIIRTIHKHFPDHDILAEESGSRQQQSDYRWVIDPLDGTTNFTHGFPVFSVSIGLEYKGKVILGVVHNPNTDQLFTAEKGQGAFLNRQRLHVSNTTTLIESMLVTGFPYNVRENPDHVVEHFTDFLMKAQAVRRLGSAALDLCYVAAGWFDGFWEVSLNPWDMAAGVLMVEEAGGRFTDLVGNPSTIYNKKMLTSNGHIHGPMVEILKKRIEQE